MRIIRTLLRNGFLLTLALTLTACGFKPQGQMTLAKPLHKLYIRTAHPYGDLSHYLASYLKASDVVLVNDPSAAQTVLNISNDVNSQELAGVSSTQQTRQYNLHVTVTFSVESAKGGTIIPPQSLTETRSITIQSNQILGSSNEATLYYQQMRRELGSAIMNRLSSHAATRTINNAFKLSKKKRSS